MYQYVAHTFLGGQDVKHSQVVQQANASKPQKESKKKKEKMRF